MSAEFTTEGRKWANLNGSHGNPHAHQNLMDEWKARAILEARKAQLPQITPPVTITAYVHRTTNAHSDAHNVTPTIKACIDAIVARNGGVGVIPDDNDGIVRELRIRRGPNMHVPAITLVISEVAEGSDAA